MHNIKQLLRHKVEDHQIQTTLEWAGINLPEEQQKKVINDMKNLNFSSLSQHLEDNPITPQEQRGDILTALGITGITQTVANYALSYNNTSTQDIEKIVECLLNNSNPNHLKKELEAASDFVYSIPDEVNKTIYEQACDQATQQNILITIRLSVLLGNTALFDHYFNHWKTKPDNQEKSKQDYYNEVFNQPPMQEHIESLASMSITPPESDAEEKLLDYFCQTHGITMNEEALIRIKFTATIDEKKNSLMEKLLLDEPKDKLQSLWEIACDWVLNLWNNMTGKTEENRKIFLEILDKIQSTAEQDPYLTLPQYQAIKDKINDLKEQIKNHKIGEDYTDQNKVAAEILALQDTLATNSQNTLESLLSTLSEINPEYPSSLQNHQEKLVNEHLTSTLNLYRIIQQESNLKKTYDVSQHLKDIQQTNPTPEENLKTIFKGYVQKILLQSRPTGDADKESIKTEILQEIDQIPQRFNDIKIILRDFINQDPMNDDWYDHITKESSTQQRSLAKAALAPGSLEDYGILYEAIELRNQTLEETDLNQESSLRASHLAVGGSDEQKEIYSARAYLYQMHKKMIGIAESTNSVQEISTDAYNLLNKHVFSLFSNSPQEVDPPSINSALEETLTNLKNNSSLNKNGLATNLSVLIDPNSTRESFAASLNNLKDQAEKYSQTGGQEGIDPELYSTSIKIAKTLWVDNQSLWQKGLNFAQEESKEELIEKHQQNRLNKGE
ncbi:MAG TPA: hypothetical protein QF353_04805 [Gammaproteobacteria bacterium]|nr:hypothetical protein [Gammaproteobacteria bacterium]